MKMTTIKVKNNYYIDVTRERDPEDEWSGEDTDTTNNITGIEIVKGKNPYGDLDVTFEVKPGQKYYLLYAIYSTGDLFSHHEGSIDYIELYENEELANASAKMIADDYAKYRKLRNTSYDNYSCDILNSQGNTFSFSCPWKGYFEDLTNVDVAEVKVPFID